MEHKLISVRKEIAFAGACPCSKQKQRKRMAVINAVELSRDDRIKNASRIGSGCAGSTEYKKHTSISCSGEFNFKSWPLAKEVL